MFTEKTIEDIFTYHDSSDPEVIRKYIAIREGAKQFAKILVTNTPMSADQTAAMRKLRECVMTANAAVALDGRV